jgi:transcriptional regulator with GAF, ATPase, and Fis domain
MERARVEAARSLAFSRAGKAQDARAALDEAVASLERARAGLAPHERTLHEESPLSAAIAVALIEQDRVSGRAPVAEPRPAIAPVADGSRFRERLLSLVRATHEANSTDAIDAQLALMLDGAIAAFGAERGLIVRVDERGPRKVLAARGLAGELVEKSASSSVIEKVAHEGEAVILGDASEDAAWRDHASISELHLRSVLAVPLRLAGKTTHVLYLEHRSAAGRFKDEDRDLCEAFADLAAVALERTRLVQEARRREAELASRADEITRLNKALSAKVEEQSVALEDVSKRLDERERELGETYSYSNIIGRSETMRLVFKLLDKVAECDVPVLIQGESGTGKELVAKAIHWNGRRQKKAFLSINCAAFPESLLESELFGHTKGAFTGADRDKKGLFEEAHEGTLFLDEVGDMSSAMQTKLLRALQEGEVRPIGAKATRTVDVRIVSASNKDLRQLVEQGRFRADLFYRLNVIAVKLPPLRERKEDIPLLVEHFLDKIAERSRDKRKVVDRKAIERLVEYDWPGNVRELENELRRSVALSGPKVTDRDLSTHVRGREVAPETQDEPVGASGLTLKARVESIERKILVESLRNHENNKTRTAKALGLSRYGFLKKLDKYRLRSASEGEEDAIPADLESEDASEA